MIRALLIVLLLSLCPNPAQAAQCNWDQASGWVARENLKKGDPFWDDGVPLRYSADYSRRNDLPRMEGYLSSTSAGCADKPKLTTVGSKDFSANIYRMGYYNGAEARLIATLENPQSITITSAMTPGQYLIKLVSKDRASSFVPLVVKGSARSDITFISSVLTWQSYNQWGGKSLYKGADGARETEASVVGFNRPYDGDGSGQFRYMEQGIITMAEKLGLDINYLTDIDVDRDQRVFTATDSIVLGGHSEYWTQAMRNSIKKAVSRGVNLLIFGGNTGYRLSIIDKREIFGRTPFRELGNPESLILGSQFFAAGIKKDLVASNSWPFSILGKNITIKGVYGYEADTAMGTRGPGVQILARAVISPTEKGFVAMSTYYIAPSGAVVLNMGTNGWVCALNNRCPWGHTFDETSQKQLQLVTQEILNKSKTAKWPVAQIDIPTRP